MKKPSEYRSGVDTKEWDRYVGLEAREGVLCTSCYVWIEQLIDERSKLS